MTSADRALVVAAAVLAISGAAWGWRALGRREGPAGPDAAPTPALRVEAVRAPEYLTVERDPEPVRNGFLRIAPGAGERLLGLVVAKAYPEEDGAPRFSAACDVSPVQTVLGLDLVPWLRQAPGETSAAWHLHVVARIAEADGGETWRSGWCVVRPADAAGAGALLTLTPRRRATVTVRDLAGRGVPGALVAFDFDPLLPAGMCSAFALTDAEGRVRLGGLASGRMYTVRLPDGAGPVTASLERRLAADAESLDVVAPVDDAWEYVAHRLVLPLPGASSSVLAPSPARDAHAAAFPVAPWIAPGWSGERTWWWAVRRTRAADAPTRVAFAKRDAVELADPARPARFEFHAFDGGVDVSAR